MDIWMDEMVSIAVVDGKIEKIDEGEMDAWIERLV